MRKLAKINLSQSIKAKAFDLGFENVGFADLSSFNKDEDSFQRWIDSGFNADMSYMNRNVEKRINPAFLVEGAKSAIVVAYNYYSEKIENESRYKISQYALGDDYHNIIKEKLHELLIYIQTLDKNANGRCFVDSAPILERSLAKRAGLGWIGKNTSLINKNIGSFLFLGEIFINIELNYDNEFEQEYCGACTRCIDACPTGALESPYILNANKCISYQTIENKQEIPEDLKGHFKDWIFGCDICQNICPWNNKSIVTKEKRFFNNKELLKSEASFWKNMSEEEFNKYFKNSPLARTGYRNFMRNIKFLK